LEGGTKDEIRTFEALFKGVSTRFGLRIVENSIENTYFIFCSSFQNIRLGSIKYEAKCDDVMRRYFIEIDLTHEFVEIYAPRTKILGR
jgi:hypothetical protein